MTNRFIAWVILLSISTSALSQRLKGDNQRRAPYRKGGRPWSLSFLEGDSDEGEPGDVTIIGSTIVHIVSPNENSKFDASKLEALKKNAQESQRAIVPDVPHDDRSLKPVNATRSHDSTFKINTNQDPKLITGGNPPGSSGFSNTDPFVFKQEEYNRNVGNPIYGLNGPREMNPSNQNPRFPPASGDSKFSKNVPSLPKPPAPSVFSNSDPFGLKQQHEALAAPPHGTNQQTLDSSAGLNEKPTLSQTDPNQDSNSDQKNRNRNIPTNQNANPNQQLQQPPKSLKKPVITFGKRNSTNPVSSGGQPKMSKQELIESLLPEGYRNVGKGRKRVNQGRSKTGRKRRPFREELFVSESDYDVDSDYEDYRRRGNNRRKYGEDLPRRRKYKRPDYYDYESFSDEE